MPRPLLLSLPLFALAGCGGGGDAPANQAAQGPGQPAAPGDVSISTPEGRLDIRSGAGAAAYPEGIPPYPGATADQSAQVSAATAPGGSGGGRILGFRTGDQPAQVIAFYAEAAARAGYRVVTRIESASGATLIVQRGAGEGLSISATRIGDFTQGQIIAPEAAAAR